MKTTEPAMTKMKTNPWSPGVCCFWGAEIVRTLESVDFSNTGKPSSIPEVYTPIHTQDAALGFQSLAAKHFGTPIKQDGFGNRALKCLAAKHSPRRPGIRALAPPPSSKKCLAAKLLRHRHPSTPTNCNQHLCATTLATSIVLKRTPVINTCRPALLDKLSTSGIGIGGSKFFPNFPIQRYGSTRFSDYYLDAHADGPVSRIDVPGQDIAYGSLGNRAQAIAIKRRSSSAFTSALPAADRREKSLAAKQMDIRYPTPLRHRRANESICLAAKHGDVIETREVAAIRPSKTATATCGAWPKSLAAKHALRTELPVKQVCGKAQMERTMNTS